MEVAGWKTHVQAAHRLQPAVPTDPRLAADQDTRGESLQLLRDIH
jgi:hypothetical protein